MGRGSGLSGEDGLITPQPVILWQLPPTNDTEMGERWSLTDQPEMHATPPEQIFSCLWDNLFYWTLGKLSKTIQLCSNSIKFMSPGGGSRAGLWGAVGGLSTGNNRTKSPGMCWWWCSDDSADSSHYPWLLLTISFRVKIDFPWCWKQNHKIWDGSSDSQDDARSTRSLRVTPPRARIKLYAL